jgi:hypothetical protein
MRPDHVVPARFLFPPPHSTLHLNRFPPPPIAAGQLIPIVFHLITTTSANHHHSCWSASLLTTQPSPTPPSCKMSSITIQPGRAPRLTMTSHLQRPLPLPPADLAEPQIQLVRQCRRPLMLPMYRAAREAANECSRRRLERERREHRERAAARRRKRSSTGVITRNHRCWSAR